MRPVLLIDNLDSFTYNLVESLERLGAEVLVRRNRIAAADALAEAQGKGAIIMISPGPGAPKEAGCCLDLIALAKGKVPVIGICLGHQALVEQAGGAVTRAPDPVHGKSMLLSHDGAGPFAGLENPVRVGRYHSLCTRDLPGRFTVHAAVDGMAMAFSDAEAMQAGLQFHPESILTTRGDAMLANLLAMFA
ncbi:aminodeoxychorismate/anthranilate synthase component II [Sphingomonas sp. LHG3406-1]|uniref:anthranilate synthase component II n=1 Tax=Sphingomonas sp. LHG3406-1 TaxID=2804617 RepID=UPI00260B1FDA|nr:aminodeoxychorismate/anthranilate synthase component II [Sphingomonas sp. LHG3406-1]